MNKQEYLQLMESIPDFTRLKIEGMVCIEEIFASSDQIIALSIFNNIESLAIYWEQTAQELAVNVQSRLTGKYDSLRWDIYLLFIIEGPATPLELKVKIENDRQFFRKVVIDSSKAADNGKVPLVIHKFHDADARSNYLFENRDFLDKLFYFQSDTTNLKSFFEAESIMNTAQLTEYMTNLKV